jgi:pimeloyl-ACP methyl ester carboxylesterase
MGAGHFAYTTEIAYYAGKGYAVVGFDNYGCGESGGKNMRGFYAGTEALIAAYIAVKSDERLKNKKVYLVGHSWGAYSVLCAQERISVDGVVAFAPFNSPVKVVHDIAAANAGGFIGALVTPGAWLMNACRFGAKGNTKAVKAIAKGGTPTMVIWGEKDPVVVKDNSVACLAKSENVTCVVEKDKGHNPYNTVEAEAKLAELLGSLGSKKDEELTAYLASFDWAQATAEDLPLMQKTVDFIENN